MLQGKQIGMKQLLLIFHLNVSNNLVAIGRCLSKNSKMAKSGRMADNRAESW